MGKRLALLMALIITVSFVSRCTFIKYEQSPVSSGAPTQDMPSNPVSQQPEKAPDPMKEQVDSMTLDEKIGQMFIAGIDGYTFDDNVKGMIEKYHVGGFIILGKNVESTGQLLKLVNSLKAGNSKSRIPLFMAIDQEGGRVDRMPSEFYKYPSNKEIGQINDSGLSFNIGSTMAEEIKSFGFNMDFAPVLDINSNPKNPIIGDRSFGPGADIVSKLGIQTMKGIQSQNVISVVKHFPGHGDTSVDSHVGLPEVSNDLDRLKSLELIPFAQAVKNNTDGVMIAHILLPKIDPENPASMSRAVITGILRNQMGFNGVVITDDMTMGAISKNYNMGDAAVKSINAGSDIILVANGYDNEAAVIDALKKAASDGTIPKERIDESVYRILKLKQKYGLSDSIISSVDIDKINKRISDTLGSYIKK